MFFSHVPEAPVDSIFGISAAFNADLRSNKVNLSVGVYKSPDLKTALLQSVKKAEIRLVEEETTKDYLPIDGEKQFLEHAGALVFGEGFWAKERGRICAAQGVGGTGALRMGGDFLKQHVSDTLYISDPTWPNHRGVFAKSGFKVDSYPYYDKELERVDFEKMVDFLAGLAPKTVVVLHGCCHNPTGADLSLNEWKVLSQLFFEKQLIPFFDFAYQGFGEGVEEDAQGIRTFAEAGHQMLVASSYSKNFTLYSERVGALFVIAKLAKEAAHVSSQVRTVIRTNYSNPPRHGAAVVGKILSTRELREEWEMELTAMRERIIEMRHAFARALVVKHPRFLFLEQRKGLFCFCGLQAVQVDRITREYGIFMTRDGRINVAGLNWDNIEYVVNAVAAVL